MLSTLILTSAHVTHQTIFGSSCPFMANQTIYWLTRPSTGSPHHLRAHQTISGLTRPFQGLTRLSQGSLDHLMAQQTIYWLTRLSQGSPDHLRAHQTIRLPDHLTDHQTISWFTTPSYTSPDPPVTLPLPFLSTQHYSQATESARPTSKR